MSACYANVVGGIGNQLFIVAAAYSYAKKYGKELYINPSKWSGSQGRHVNNYKDTIFKNFKYSSYYTRDVISIKEKRFNYDEPPFHRGSVSFDGYFQSLKYFQDYKDEFINLLNLPEVKKDFIHEKSVGFHIRRGDYLKFPHIFNVCDTNYFNERFEEFKDYEINVFTDSDDHVLAEFPDKNFRIIKGNNELEDLTIITHHSTIVCSNSSFSWWASIMGVHKNKILVPSKWLLDRDCSDIYTNEMIKIEV